MARGLRGLGVRALVFALVVLAAPARSRPAPASTPGMLTVFAAASLAEAFGEIGRQFEHQHPGLTLRFNFAGSQQLAAQIEQGARADVFAAADERTMKSLEDRALLEDGSRAFARNRLVVIVPRSNPGRIGRLQDLARRGIKLVLGAETVPVGHYSRDMLENLGRAPGFGPDYTRHALANLVSEEENVKSVAAKVQLGEADAGVVYRSDVTPAVARKVRVLEVPDSCNVEARYPVAVLKGAPRAESARAFVDWLLAPAGQEALARHGFLPVAAAAP
jgi:molybdate transport system substrate-binding protein